MSTATQTARVNSSIKHDRGAAEGLLASPADGSPPTGASGQRLDGGIEQLATSTRMTEAIRMKTSSVVRPRKNGFSGTSRMARDQLLAERRLVFDEDCLPQPLQRSSAAR